jgi:hypothetical protein
VEIQKMVQREGDLGSNFQMKLTERAPIWRKQVSGAESGIADILSNLLEAARKAETERNMVRSFKKYPAWCKAYLSVQAQNKEQKISTDYHNPFEIKDVKLIILQRCHEQNFVSRNIEWHSGHFSMPRVV